MAFMVQGLRAAYVTDSMTDLRMLEGIGMRTRLTLVAPSSLGDRVTNFWPPRPPAEVDRELLPGGRLAFVPRSIVWLLRNRRSIDVVFVLDNLAAALAATTARALGGPPVVIQVGRPTLDYLRCQRGLVPPWKWTLKYAVVWSLVQWNERRADAIGAVSEYCADQCRARNANVSFVPWYGVDTDVFKSTTTKEAAKVRLGLPTDRPAVMLRSRIAPEKDPATFLQAVEVLRAEGRVFSAVYMGGELEEIAEANADIGVELIARKPSGVDEIPIWYEAVDINVQSSLAEGLGVSPLEALACGTPVVVSAAGGLPEVVDNGRVGALVPVGDVRAMADAIATYLDDPVLGARHAAEGRRWVEERFSVEGAFDTWMDLAISAAPSPALSTPRTTLRVLFVDHETRLSGGELDLVDLVRGLGDSIDAHVALPGEGTLADALRQHGATVHLVHMGEDLRSVSRWELSRPSPSRLAGQIGAAAGVAWGLVRLVHRLRPDVVHTNSMKSHLLSVPAALIARRPLVWHVRDILQPGWLLTAFTRVGALAPVRIVSLSHVAARPFDGTRAESKVRVVHNGVRPAPLDASLVATMRDRFGARDGDLVVGIVGQIAQWKGQDVFVEAAASVLAKIPEARFVIVGEVLFERNEAEFARRLQERVRGLGIEERVVFAGYVAPIEPVMAALDVAVHASRLPEPFGRVIVEAMAQGTPVVSNTIGAGVEIIDDASGRLVPPDDATALSEVLVELLSDDALRIRLGEGGRARAATFDIAATAAGVTAVWAELRR
ncbi:MAG TPA: glycosyltransferase family 4 protein [Acidimicrobiales bacterium]|nr:glycosyltransferase family 4 protein [Acidimicrobiales bacterium]